MESEKLQILHFWFVEYQGSDSPHFASVWLGQGLARDDLQQQHELQPISEVLLDVLDLGPGFPEVGVDPGCEGLKRSTDICPIQTKHYQC